MNENTIKSIYDSNRLKRAFNDICNKISQDYTQGFDCIVGLSRGGLIPATYFSHKLNVSKLIVCGLKSYNGKVADTIEVYQHITPEQLQNCNNILIVDDISDKGCTLEYMVQYVTERVPTANIRTATVCIKENTKFIPDWYDKVYDSNWWIEFDWEL